MDRHQRTNGADIDAVQTFPVGFIAARARVDSCGVRSYAAMKRVAVALLFASWPSGCDREGPRDCPADVPDDWDCPIEQGPFELSACEPVDGYPPMSVEVTRLGDTLSIAVLGVLLRDDNEVCGWAERDLDTIRILLQPCVLRPNGVSKGDCWYDSITFDLSGLDIEDVHELVVFKRVDRSAELPPYEPEEIARVTLP